MSQPESATIMATWTEYKRARRRFHRYRHAAGLGEKVALAIGFAALTGVAAQVRVPLPFTPVPITMQTFAVLLAGVVLGARWGGGSQAIYAGLGAAGVPWFTGMGAGLGTILGPTGGFIIGFIPAAVLTGLVVDRYPRARQFPVLLGVLAVANFIVIYGVGLPWLFAWITLVQGSMPTLAELLTMGLLPFIPGDLVKLFGAAAIATAVLPETTDGTDRGLDGTDGENRSIR